jgi:hypothetical protein
MCTRKSGGIVSTRILGVRTGPGVGSKASMNPGHRAATRESLLQLQLFFAFSKRGQIALNRVRGRFAAHWLGYRIGVNLLV